MSNDRHPPVTIAIPTYNRADSYLKQALAGALNQTYDNIEIIVSDNCSTDETESLMKGMSDPRLRYVRQSRNIPANDNFNFCLQQAKGTYFLLLHDDDIIDPDLVEICMRTANYATNIGLIRAGARIIDAHGNVLRERQNLDRGLSTGAFFLAWLESKSWMFLCSILFNTRLLRSLGGFRSKHQRFQDVLAEFQLAAQFGRVDVPDIKASLRKHPAQRAVSAKLHEWCEDSLTLLEAMCEMVPEMQNVIRNKGMVYFAKHNYDLASGIKSPFRRYVAYITVYKTFSYRHSPVRFFYQKVRRQVFSRLHQMNRKLRGMAMHWG